MYSFHPGLKITFPSLPKRILCRLEEKWFSMEMLLRGRVVFMSHLELKRDPLLILQFWNKKGILQTFEKEAFPRLKVRQSVKKTGATSIKIKPSDGNKCGVKSILFIPDNFPDSCVFFKRITS